MILDQSEHPWVALVPAQDLADMREDLASGPDAGHCSHGDPHDEVIRQCRYFALDSAAPPANWSAFDFSAQLWFGYLDAGSQAACRDDFAGAASDKARERLFYEWRSTGAVMSDPVLSASLLKPHLDQLEGVEL